MATTDNPLSSSSMGGNGSSEGGLKQRVSDMTSHVKSTASEYGRSAADNMDRNLQSAAGALERAASTLRSKTGDTANAGGRMTQMGQTAAQKLETTARYLREHDTRDMVQGVESAMRRKPGMALGIALGLGFLLGMTMKRDRY